MGYSWNRGSTLIAFGAQGVLAFAIMICAAIDVGISRAQIKRANALSSYSSYGYSYYSYDYSTGPESYPYGFSLLMIALATIITLIITFPLAIAKKAIPIGVAIPNIIWALAWLGLFGYGIYALHYYSDFACAGSTSSGCNAINADLAALIFTPFELIATIFVVVIAFRANGRKGRKTGPEPGLYGPSASTPPVQQYQQPQQAQPPVQQYQQPQQAPPVQQYQAPTMHQAYANQIQAQQQQQPQMTTAPGNTTSFYAPSQDSSIPPPQSTTPQPFYQNGQWYQYQPVPLQNAAPVSPQPQQAMPQQPQPSSDPQPEVVSQPRFEGTTGQAPTS